MVLCDNSFVYSIGVNKHQSYLLCTNHCKIIQCKSLFNFLRNEKVVKIQILFTEVPYMLFKKYLVEQIQNSTKHNKM